MREAFVHQFMSKYGKVMEVKRDRILLEPGRYCYGGGYTVEMVMSDVQRQEVPHLVKYDLGISMLITMQGKPPLCLKCLNIGHIRRDCPENKPRPTGNNSYSQAVQNQPKTQVTSDPEVRSKEPDRVPVQRTTQSSTAPPKSGRLVPPEPVSDPTPPKIGSSVPPEPVPDLDPEPNPDQTVEDSAQSEIGRTLMTF